MIRKTFLFILIIGTLSQENVLQAQDPQFSQYYAAPLYLNPGLTGITQRGRMGINYRTQWPTLEANFETFSAYSDYYFEEYQSSVGIIFTTDKAGSAGLRSSTVGLQYAYQLQLNQDWIFRPGVEGAYTFQDLDFNKLVFGDQLSNAGNTGNPTGEVFNTGLNVKFFDLSFGGVLHNSSLWVGVAAHHILEPNQSIAGEDSPLPKRLSIHGGYRISLPSAPSKIGTGERSITPSINYRTQGDFDQLDLGAYFTLNPILIGLWYRGVPIKNTTGIVNNEALIFILGVQSKQITFGYSYDYTISSLGIGTGGTHEISLSYAWGQKGSKASRKPMCPIPSLHYKQIRR